MTPEEFEALRTRLQVALEERDTARTLAEEALRRLPDKDLAELREAMDNDGGAGERDPSPSS